jgi:ferredoxin
VEQAPNRWQMSKRDGKCVLLGGKEKGGMFQVDVSEAEREATERAASVCPVHVIRIST